MTPVNLMQFSTRTRHCLLAERLLYTELVAKMSDEELLDVPNLGKVCLSEIRAVIPRKHSVFILMEQLKDGDDAVLKVYGDKESATQEAARLKSLRDIYFYVIERELV